MPDAHAAASLPSYFDPVHLDEPGWAEKAAVQWTLYGEVYYVVPQPVPHT